MRKDELLKLAEIAKVEVRVANENLIYDDCTPWAPDVNLDEAMECLAALGKDYIIDKVYKLKAYEVCIELPHINSGRVVVTGIALALVICKAVLKAGEEG